MKKNLFILSLTAINVYAVNCLDMIQATLYNSANKYHLDSAYIENYGSDFSYYASMKYHYTENNLDSIVHCTNEKCSTIHQRTIEEKTEHSIKTTTYYDKQIIQEENYIIGKDSSFSYIYSPAISEQPEIDYTRISYLRHDTLFTEVWEQPENVLQKNASYFVTPDPNNENICIETSYELSSNPTYKVISPTENGFVISLKDSEEKVFYTLVKSNSSTTILRKKRPIFSTEKTKAFDILGRPAKNKHIVKVKK